MKIILRSLGILINKENFSALIQTSLYSLKKRNNHNIPLEKITDSDDELDMISKDSELILNEIDNECDVGKLLT